jgi:hypothetical protein
MAPLDGDNGLVAEPREPGEEDPETVPVVLADALCEVESQNAALPAASVVSDAAMSVPVTARARRVPVVRSDIPSPFLVCQE